MRHLGVLGLVACAVGCGGVSVLRGPSGAAPRSGLDLTLRPEFRGPARPGLATTPGPVPGSPDQAVLVARSLARIAGDIAQYHVDAPTQPMLLGAAARALAAYVPGSVDPPGDADAVELESEIRASVRAIAEVSTHFDPDLVGYVGLDAMLAGLHDGSHLTTVDALARKSLLDATFGLLLAQDTDGVHVVGVAPGSPAWDARVFPPARIVSIEGASTRALRVVDVAGRLRLHRGAEVRIGVEDGAGGSRTAVLDRRRLQSSQTDCRLLARDTLYLRPKRLSRTASAQIATLADGTNPTRLVLDLRGLDSEDWPGGRDVVDLVLAEGTVHREEGQHRHARWVASAGTSVLERARVVILVDHETRGAAELVAASLQDAHRARVLGERTAGFGDVLIESVSREGVLLRIPNLRVLRADGRRLAEGVTPDVVGGPATPAGGAALEEVACPGDAGGPSVSADRLVARAVREVGGAQLGAGTVPQRTSRLR